MKDRLLVLYQIADFTNPLFLKAVISLSVFYESSRQTIDLDALLSKSPIRESIKQVRKAAEKNIGDAVPAIHFKSIKHLREQQRNHYQN